MLEITYTCDKPVRFSEKDKANFVSLLKKQGKVKPPTIARINSCLLICTARVDGIIVSIGAIKPKTSIDFKADKAALPELDKYFIWELGYCFTEPEHSGKGYSSTVVKLLLSNIKKMHLMASTELRYDNGMIKILEKVGFKQFGKPWKSTLHTGFLGLFLRFENLEG